MCLFEGETQGLRVISARSTSHVPSCGFASFQGPRSIVFPTRESRRRVAEHARYLMDSVAKIRPSSESISMRVHVLFMLVAAAYRPHFACSCCLPRFNESSDDQIGCEYLTINSTTLRQFRNIYTIDERVDRYYMPNRLEALCR